MKTVIRSAVVRIAPHYWFRRRIRKLSQAEPELKLLPYLCGSGSLSIDVGANFGLWTYYLVPISLKVVAFEPLPEMQSILHRQFGKRIQLERIALSQAPGRSTIRFPIGNPSWATIEPTNNLALANGMGLASVEVVTKRLDDYDFRKVGFIKIDVEGHEEKVIEGAVNTIARERPNIVVEAEERHNAGSVLRLANRFHDLGYDGFFVDRGFVRDVASFDLSQDQPPGNVSVRGKVGRYINNFIYIPAERRAAICTNIGVEEHAASVSVVH